jgi:hypothetical protein
LTSERSSIPLISYSARDGTMKEINASDHLAVLIDGDNVSLKIVANLLAKVANYGTASVKRIYGD